MRVGAVTVYKAVNGKPSKDIVDRFGFDAFSALNFTFRMLERDANSGRDSINPVSGGTAPFKYRAFISYSHRDRRWGDWLHGRLETYRVPRRLVGRAERCGPVPRRLFPVFRDHEELPSSPDLSEAIRQALERSQSLIVICSPHAATSRWVNEEVRIFKQLGRVDRILCLIVDGEPNATDKPDRGLTECFPPAIRFAVSSDGSPTSDRVEPIAADVRSGSDTRADAVLKLVAGILGVAYDELKLREQRRQRRRVVTAVLAAVALLAAFAGVWEWQETRRQRDDVRARSQAETLDAQALADQGRPDKAMALLAHALRMDASNKEALGRLHTLLTRRNWLVPLPVPPLPPAPSAARPYHPVPQGYEFLDSMEGFRLIGRNQKETYIWDETKGELGPAMLHPWKVERGKFSADGSRVLTVALSEKERQNAQTQLAIWDRETGKSVGPPIQVEGRVEIMQLGPGGSQLLTVVTRQAPKSNAPDALTDDETVATVWDVSKGTPLHATPPVEDQTYADLSPDKAILFLHGRGGCFYDTATLAPRGQAISANTYAHDVVFSEDSTRALFTLKPHDSGVLQRQTLRLWNRETQSSDGDSLVTDGEIGKCLFSHDGSRFAVLLSENGPGRRTSRKILFYNGLSGVPLGMSIPLPDALEDMSFNADDRWLLTNLNDGSGHAWDMRTGREACEPLRGAASQRVTFMPENTRLERWPSKPKASATPGRPEWWSGFDRSRNVISMETNNHVTSTILSPDGKVVAAATQGGVVRTFDSATGERLALDLAGLPNVASLVFSPDSRRLIVAARATGPSRGQSALAAAEAVGNARGRARVHRKADEVMKQTAPEGGHVPLARAATPATPAPPATPAQKPVTVAEAAGGAPGNRGAKGPAPAVARAVQVWDLQTGQAIGSPVDEGVTAVAWNPRGDSFLAIGAKGTKNEGKITVWDAATGQRRFGPLASSAKIVAAAYVPQGDRFVVLATDGSVRLYEATGVEKGLVLQVAATDSGHAALAIAPTGNLLAVVDGDSLKLAEIKAGNPAIWKLESGFGVENAVFSPDGKMLAATVYPTAIELWDVLRRSLVCEPLGQEEAVANVAFSPDGRWLVSALENGIAQLWEAATGRRVGDPMRHSHSLRSARFTPDGRRVMTVPVDRSIRIGPTEVDVAQFWEVAMTPEQMRGPGPAEIAIATDLAEAVSGYRKDASGALLPVDDPLTLLESLQQRINEPATRELTWAGVARAILTEEANRPTVAQRWQSGRAKIKALCEQNQVDCSSMATLRMEVEHILSALHVPPVDGGQFKYGVESFPSPQIGGGENTEQHRDAQERLYNQLLARQVAKAWDLQDEEAATARECDGILTQFLEKRGPAIPGDVTELREGALRLRIAWQMHAVLKPRSGQTGTAEVEIPRIEPHDGKEVTYAMIRSRVENGHFTIDRTGIRIEFEHARSFKHTPDGINLYGPKDLYYKGTRILSWSPKTLADMLLEKQSRPEEYKRMYGSVKWMATGLSMPLERANALVAATMDSSHFHNSEGTLDPHEFDFVAVDGISRKVWPQRSGGLLFDAATGQLVGFGSGIELIGTAPIDDWDMALADFNAALKLNDKNVPSLLGRAEIYRMRNQWSVALTDYTAVLAIEPGDFRALLGQASALSGRGDLEKALAVYGELMQKFPTEAQPFNDCAWLLATSIKDNLRNGQRAVELASHACLLTDYKNPGYLDTLATAFAEKGEFAQAVQWQEEAVKAAAQQPADVQADIQSRVQLYKQNKPYREPLK